MAITASFTDWRIALRDMLIRSGTDGLRQSRIVERMSSYHINADPIIDLLEAWENEDKVQSFEVVTGPRGGRPATIWRATTLLLKETGTADLGEGFRPTIRNTDRNP